MPTLEWSDELVLGLAPMDATHEEFVSSYQALAGASPEDFLARMDDFVAHCDAHFDQENRWMEAVSFPGCHRAEHDRVLEVLRDVRRHVAGGDAFLGRRLVEELPAWFENHANGMDAALVFHLDSIGYDVVTGTQRVTTSSGGDTAPSSSPCACATPTPVESTV
ncbi:MAG: bacteriohemerythrin [Zoogloeaceae bacterium]|nr:bacteriohemerythrin [Zoogloeaceae bacterium]